MLENGARSAGGSILSATSIYGTASTFSTVGK